MGTVSRIRPLPEGHVELVRWYRTGPWGDEKEFEVVRGRLVSEDADRFVVEVDGELQGFVRELRKRPNGPVVRQGWVRS